MPAALQALSDRASALDVPTTDVVRRLEGSRYSLLGQLLCGQLWLVELLLACHQLDSPLKLHALPVQSNSRYTSAGRVVYESSGLLGANVAHLAHRSTQCADDNNIVQTRCPTLVGCRVPSQASLCLFHQTQLMSAAVLDTCCSTQRLTGTARSKRTKCFLKQLLIEIELAKQTN